MLIKLAEGRLKIHNLQMEREREREREREGQGLEARREGPATFCETKTPKQ